VATTGLVIATIAVPILGALTIPLAALLGRKVRTVWANLLAYGTVACGALLLPNILHGLQQNVVNNGLLSFMGIDDWFMVDALAVFVAVVASSIGALIVSYSIGYIADTENETEYYTMVLLFIGSMMGIVFSANLLFLYLFWEVAAICSWRLIGYYRKPEFVKRADKAFLITFLGASAMLLGFLMVFTHASPMTFDIAKLRGLQLTPLMMFLIFAGMIAKSATFPLHTWLPDAGIAPSPVTGLLHAALLVKIGVYGFARLFCYTFTLPGYAPAVLGGIVMGSAFIAACAAMVENDLKRILAYSTISQIGYIFLGFAMFKSQVALAGSIFYILAHGLGKAALFLCAGVIEHGAGTKDIRELGGLMKKMPVTAIVFFASALSVIGIPPFAGFYSKFMVIAGTIQQGQIVLAAIAIFTAFMTLIYLLRVFNKVFMGELTHPQAHEGTRSMLVTISIFAILSLVVGLLVAFPMGVVKLAAAQMVGR
jgi:NADH:ubiquinone oxidoreductase subunit 5 (subunit L)/multisubunit Na+/H+ antiporter MnhA subunit